MKMNIGPMFFIDKILDPKLNTAYKISYFWKKTSLLKVYFLYKFKNNLIQFKN